MNNEEENKKDITDEPINFNTFNPMDVPFQRNAIAGIQGKIKCNGTQIVLFSGSMGSGKTVTACNLLWRHLLDKPNRKVGIGRKDLPRLKRTLLRDFLEHKPEEFVEDEDYTFNKTDGKLTILSNGSTLQCYSWADKNWDRFKGEEFSMFVIEEATESDMDAFTIINARMGRSKRFKEKFLLLLTNPGEPDHWIARNIIDKAGFVDGVKRLGDPLLINENIHVYYSLTKDNPHIDPVYIQNLLKTNHQKWIQRNLEGRWVSFGGEGIYFAFNEDDHYIKEDYKVDLSLPIHLTWDFNVAEGKPMSACFFQYHKGKDQFYFFDEVIMHNSNTDRMLDEMYNRGLFDYPVLYVINGDASGWGKRSASNGWSDYEIMNNYFSKMKHKAFKYTIEVDGVNPSIRSRHAMVNAYLKNGLGEKRLFIYKKCKVLVEAMKLTKLKKGSDYQEEDQNEYQHVGTSLGYGLNTTLLQKR